MKRKIAIVIPSLRGGGAERVMVNIVRHLDLEKVNLRLIIVKNEGPFKQKVPEHIDVIDLNCSRARYAIFKLIRHLNEFQPEVIFSTLGHLNLILLGLRKFLKGNTRIIVREANTPSKNLERLTKWKKIIFKLLYKLLYPTADIIIAQCKDMKHDIVKTFDIDEKKVIYIYNPLDIKSIEKDSHKFNPYDNSKINIVAVGRLTFQKGFDILIEAFKLVNDQMPNTHLTILGEGHLKERLIQQTIRLNLKDKISIIGFKINPYPYYRYADLYVLSSRWEGFPNTLLEALACNTKVVATNCESGPREILEDNEYGVLVNASDYKSLAFGILESIKNNNKTKDRAKIFDINSVIKEYEKELLK